MESTRPARKWQMRRGVVGAAALVLALAGCDTSGGSATTNSGSGNAVAAAVTDNVAKYKGLPTFTAPGDAIDPSTLRGKSMFLIPLVPNPFNQNIQETMEGIAKKVGMNFTIYPNQGTPSEWVQGMNAALTAKPDIIVLSTAPDPRTLQPQLEQAKAAGIPVLVTHFYDDSTPPPPACAGCAAGVTSLETAKFNLSAKLMADWVILHSNGRADVLIPILLGVIPTPGMEAVFKAEFSKYCPSCKTKYINVPAAAFGTSDFSNSVEASISGDPNLNWVLEQFDPVVPSIVSSIATAGRTGKVNVVSYAGDTAVLAEMQSQSGVVMDVGESQPWIAYATMDQAFRTMLGKPVRVESSPLRIWNSANVHEAGTPPTTTSGYGNSYITGFMSLWGLK